MKTTYIYCYLDEVLDKLLLTEMIDSKGDLKFIPHIGETFQSNSFEWKINRIDSAQHETPYSVIRMFFMFSSPVNPV